MRNIVFVMIAKGHSTRLANKNKLEFHGYYYDGKKLFLMYMDEYGNIVTKEDRDE